MNCTSKVLTEKVDPSSRYQSHAGTYVEEPQPQQIPLFLRALPMVSHQSLPVDNCLFG